MSKALIVAVPLKQEGAGVSRFIASTITQFRLSSTRRGWEAAKECIHHLARLVEIPKL
ncbi:hypothetical protein [Infirmifilum uzonense]|uniref:hypothetical protein n=1 Tax=Infirmifilum uzonense TaxID=1550241 RepID=UPI00168CB0EC|nr:hypothetical protein [Infirmifilum uzonense]